MRFGVIKFYIASQRAHTVSASASVAVDVDRERHEARSTKPCTRNFPESLLLLPEERPDVRLYLCQVR